MGPPATDSTGTTELTPQGTPKVRRWGGVVFLGPIPLVFGSDPQMTRWMLILGAILFLALVLLTIALLIACRLFILLGHPPRRDAGPDHVRNRSDHHREAPHGTHVCRARPGP